MKRILFIACTAFLLISCKDETKTDESIKGEATTPATETKPKEEPWVAVDTATAMKNYMAYATPGEPHKMLAKSNGTWNGEITMWMSPDDAHPISSTATMTNKMIMDGRYQVSETKGNMMGMPFNGIGTTGYDNHKKIFVATWLDNMGTGIMKMEGPWDEATKTTTLTGKMVDPSSGRECDFKEVYKIIDDDHQFMEMYGPDPKTGKQFKSMEIKLTRKK